ncbi:MAG: hypothetical protein LBH09_01210 [Peptococcaceae bacterium]|nr:hypothetical protein [Peptococcaceae bacterium]
MEQLFEKMKEYVKMDTEISTEEFMEDYKKVIDKLVADFDQLTEEEQFKARAIVSIMSGNAANRAKRKDADTKKFRKAQEKSQFWVDAIEYRLKKSGLSEDEIKERADGIEKEMQ